MQSRYGLTLTSSIFTMTFELVWALRLNVRRPMMARKIVDTDHGALDADVLAALQRDFATSDLLVAVEDLDVGKGRQQWLRACLLRLHGMANHLINGAPQTVAGEETIWQLAEEVGDELDAYTANLSHITKLVDRLGRLRPNHDPMPDRGS
jgi:hypothetical protein